MLEDITSIGIHMKKNIILLLAGLLILAPLFSGCLQENYIVSIVPQRIGDEVTYTLTFSTTTTSTDPYSSESSTESNTINGTIFSKVNKNRKVSVSSKRSIYIS